VKRCDALAFVGNCDRPLPCPIHNRVIYELHKGGALDDEQAVRLCGYSPTTEQSGEEKV
jgi:hypothetical protein